MPTKPRRKSDGGKLARRIARLEDAHRRDLARLQRDLIRMVHHSLEGHEQAYHDNEKP